MHIAGFRLVTATVVTILVAASMACTRSDEEVRSDVRARLNGDPITAGLGLSIEVKNRAVFLSGGTATAEEQRRAMELARSVDRVKLVVNDMWLNDSDLADRVRDALKDDAILGTVPIEVDAHGSVVRLMSDETNREQRARAVELASKVAGVTQVEDRMK